MSFKAIDLAKLPEPNVVKKLDYENIVQELKTYLLSKEPSLEKTLALESDPIIKLIETFAYRELTLRAHVNDSAKATMLAFAKGSDLDHKGADKGIIRQIISPADNTATPPTQTIYENDARFRERINLAPEGYSVAGPKGAYIFHALSASPLVKDVDVKTPKFSAQKVNGNKITWEIADNVGLDKPRPASVAITILSNKGNGAADKELLNIVQEHISHDNIRPLTDNPQTVSANIVEYQINAKLYFYNGLDIGLIIKTVNDNMQQFVKDKHKLGFDIETSAVHAALHVEGVQRVELQNFTDIKINWNQAAFCTNIALINWGIDE